MFIKIIFAKVYNNIIIVLNILTTIIYCFIKCFYKREDLIIKRLNKNVFIYFIIKFYEQVVIKNVIIIKCDDINNNNEDFIISENAYNDVIFILYFYIKFIILFTYLILYYISYFES